MSEIQTPTPEKKKPRKSKIFQFVRIAFLGTIMIFTKADSYTTKKDTTHNINQNITMPLYEKNLHSSSLNQYDGGNKDSEEKPLGITDEGILEIKEQIDPNIPQSNEPEVEIDFNVEPIHPDETEGYQDIIPTIVLGDGEYTQYIIDNYSQESVGIPFDGNNHLLSPNETNPIIERAFSNDPFMRSVVTLFYPKMSEEEITNYLENFKILIGEKIDYYLRIIRRGSWGTTVATVTADGQLRFETISLRSDLIANEYTDDEWGSLTRLVREEFFQAHQYNVFAKLFNSGYLAEVAGIITVDDMIEAISDEHLRAFLELLPQQKILTDSGAGGNAYNFYIGDKFFEGNPTAKLTVDAAYNTLTDFIENKLEITSTPESFLESDFIKEVNDAFREKYLEYYLNIGYHEQEINIWNLVGMQRNSFNSANSLDMPALLPLPIE